MDSCGTGEFGDSLGDNAQPDCNPVPGMTASTNPAPARILDGKRIAEDLLHNLKSRVDARVAAGKSRPGLAVVLVGNDPASEVYVGHKVKAGAEVGFRVDLERLPESATLADALLDPFALFRLDEGLLTEQERAFFEIYAQTVGGELGVRGAYAAVHELVREFGIDDGRFYDELSESLYGQGLSTAGLPRSR